MAARSGQLKSEAPAAQRSRVPIAAALVVAAATPALLLFSQSRLQASANAFDAGKCARAKTEAYKSIDDLAVRPEPYMIIGFCDIREGRPDDAVIAMQKAVEKEPRNWGTHYSLAIALAASGRDPRPEIHRVLLMNPLEDFVRTAADTFSATPTPAARRRLATAAMDAALTSGKLTLR